MYVTVLGLECAPNMYNLQVFFGALTKGEGCELVLSKRPPCGLGPQSVMVLQCTE